MPASGRRIGYARTSTTGQDTALQCDALRRDGCERIVVEAVSGAGADRPVLEECLAELAVGDTLVVWRLDRLGRSAQHLLGILERLRERGVAFRSVTEGMDTSTYMGRFVFTVLGAVAEMEREIIRERVNAGRVAARHRGRVGGRPPVVTPERLRLARRLRADGESVPAIARQLGIGRTALYEALKRSETTSSCTAPMPPASPSGGLAAPAGC
ncbi:MAG: recombinase family protein [Pseudonocardiaceae bacterium]